MSTDPELRAYVDSLSREALAALLLDLAGRVPAVADALAARRRAMSGEAGKIAASIRRDLKAFRRSGAWPDFESIQERLAQLRDVGVADAMLELARPIIEVGAELIEETEDEGDLTEEVTGCLDLIFEMLPQSSLPPHERILWAIDLELRDPYDLLIQLAIDEGRPDDALRWYDRAQAEKARLNVTDEAVAAAIAPAHPERAARIWCELSARQLKHAEVRAYDLAAHYLGRLRAVVPEPEWRAELEGLKATYRRRPRLVEAIDQVLQEP